jgi:hypothetical protein
MTVVARIASVSCLSFVTCARASGWNFHHRMRGKNVSCGFVIEIITNENFCVVYKLLQIYNIKFIFHQMVQETLMHVQQRNSVITKCIAPSWSYVL